MFPYGDDRDADSARPDDYDDLLRVGQLGADALTTVHGTEYIVGQSNEVLCRWL